MMTEDVLVMANGEIDQHLPTKDFALSIQGSAEYGKVAGEEVDFGLIDLRTQERRFIHRSS